MVNKKAYLVSFEVTTRVIIDMDGIPEGDPEDKLSEIAFKKAYSRVVEGIGDMLSDECIINIEEDTECPYGIFDDDSQFF